LPPLFATDTAIVGDTVGTVLLLEDEAHLREPLAHLLRLRHYNVVEVDTVDAALAAIRTERPDAAIVDVQVKDRSGHDVVVRMPPRAPVIIFSGTSAASGDLARLRPRTRLVEKPASLTWVIDSLDEMLQRTREFA
jgi:DNA-binding response OmpR family regulator